MSYNPNLEAFDRALAGGQVTTERGAVYDHPRNDFDRIAKLTAALPECSDPRVAHILRMMAIKMCRLSHHPRHLDSWIDIAGYARTGVMIMPEGETLMPTEENYEEWEGNTMNRFLKGPVY